MSFEGTAHGGGAKLIAEDRPDLPYAESRVRRDKLGIPKCPHNRKLHLNGLAIFAPN